MLTIILNIKQTDNDKLLEQYVQQYTGLFYKFYNNAELLKDKSTKQGMLESFPLFDTSMLEFCIKEIRMKLSQHDTNVKNKDKQVENITKELEDNDFTTKYDKRDKFKAIKKLSSLKKTKDKNICFGGKALLRLVTKYSQEIQCLNKKILKENDEKEIILLKEQRIIKQELLDKTLTEYRSNRKLGVYLIGQSLSKGNRKIDFDLNNNKIIFKPNSKNHIEIIFNEQGKKRKKLLKKLQIMAEQRRMPLTVKLYEDEIHISYDEALLNGFAFNDNECKKEQKVCVSDEEKKEVYKKHRKEQEQRMLNDKVIVRYISTDLNPSEIGLCIGDKMSNGDINYIYKEYISLEKLLIKLGVSSDDKKQVKQNNKRKHEIKEIWKYIFGLATHYGCAYFVCEDLQFKTLVGNKEANRKTRNMWHLTLTKQLITKWCNVLGIIKIEVNPAYSSFIGNLLHNDIDCIAASKEILRRGMFKFIKGNNFYPELSRIIGERLNHLHQENIDLNGITTWQAMFKLFSSAKLRYRNKDKKYFESLSGKNLNSHKSKITRRFCTCNEVYVCS